jgi:ATP-dependent helicase HrpB
MPGKGGSALHLRELAPLTLRLQAGRPAKIHYERGKSPWIASRLQDFFKMKETPRIGPNRTPVVLHLLAPNHRAVQTTTDLAGFWERLYPQVRRELMRRYPRHAWPEDPHGK